MDKKYNKKIIKLSVKRRSYAKKNFVQFSVQSVTVSQIKLNFNSYKHCTQIEQTPAFVSFFFAVLFFFL